jgi:hypothetical protein
VLGRCSTTPRTRGRRKRGAARRRRSGGARLVEPRRGGCCRLGHAGLAGGRSRLRARSPAAGRGERRRAGALGSRVGRRDLVYLKIATGIGCVWSAASRWRRGRAGRGTGHVRMGPPGALASAVSVRAHPPGRPQLGARAAGAAGRNSLAAVVAAADEPGPGAPRSRTPPTSWARTGLRSPRSTRTGSCSAVRRGGARRGGPGPRRCGPPPPTALAVVERSALAQGHAAGARAAGRPPGVAAVDAGSRAGSADPGAVGYPRPGSSQRIHGRFPLR